MELTNLNIETIVAALTGVIAIITAIYGLIQKIKAGNYKDALDDSKVIAKDLMGTINEFKELVGPVARAPIMKDLGTKLEVNGLKEQVDEALTQIGLDNKS